MSLTQLLLYILFHSTLTFTVATAGPSRATAGPGKRFSRLPLGNFFYEFFFLKRCILVYLIFLSDGGAPNVAGPVVTYPLPLPTPALHGPEL